MPRVQEAYDAPGAACKKTDTWGMSLMVVENTGHVLTWRTPPGTKNPPKWLPAAGLVLVVSLIYSFELTPHLPEWVTGLLNA